MKTTVTTTSTTGLEPKLSRHPFFQPKQLNCDRAVYPDLRAEQDNLAPKIWVKCSQCGELSYYRQFMLNAKVCLRCKYHARLSWCERLTFLVDRDSFVEINGDLQAADPLGFGTATETYATKTLNTRRKLGLNEALITGSARLNGEPLAIAVSDFAFMGASMGSVFGEKLVRLIEFAISHNYPLLTVSSSGGARMHEGLFSLMQMAKTSTALAQLARKRLPHISLLADPCYGGVTASYAMLADVILAEPGAKIGFAGPRVIEQITHQKLPADFQTAEGLFEHGMLDQVVERRELPGVLANLLNLLKTPATYRTTIVVEKETLSTELDQTHGPKLLFKVA